MSLPLRPRPDTRTLPLTILTKTGLATWLKGAAAAPRNWVEGSGFKAEPGEICLVPGEDGRPARALVGMPTEDGGEALWTAAGFTTRLPQGSYRLDPEPADKAATRFALGWALGAYAFARYKKPGRPAAELVWPAGADREAVERMAGAIFFARDLINTPAEDMGPAELAEAARAMARELGMKATVIEGDALTAKNYPLIHMVGRASARAPRLIDLRWGRSSDPRVTLVGKGVCFDTGGLDLKPESAMKNMKKDMGGAAHALALAQMIVRAELPVRLRVLVPAVENAVSGNAMRPLDVVRSRKGLTVEIGNTDAEGRLILADALADASDEKPDLIVDFATLTGAARVALGPELPALFCNDDGLAADLTRHAEAEADPMWRLPLWQPYRRRLDSRIADLNNISDGPFAGAVTAALFMQEFVGKDIPWAHFDLFAWNPYGRPGRPEGGEAQVIRAVYALIAERFGRTRRR